MELRDQPTRGDENIQKETSGNYCQKCGARNPDESFICQSCGERLIADIVSSGGKLSPEKYHDLSTALTKALEGNYQIIGEIGRGGMSIVYKALDVLLERYAAIKVLPLELTVDKKLVDRFLQEAKLAARLHHPNIVTIFAIRQVNELNFMIMNYLDGETINQLLQKQGKLSIPSALAIARDVLKALSKAHQNGIIHRDIKPDNIIVTSGDRAVVTDFGIAQALSQRKYGGSGALVGTAYYMSPEQVKGLTDERGDLYSLGVVLFKMVTGRVPFTGDDVYVIGYKHLEEPPPKPRDFNPLVPQVLEDLILRALAKQPEERFQTAEDMLEAIDRIEEFAAQESSKDSHFINDSTILNNVKHLIGLAQNAMEKGENEKAVIMLRKALTLEPGHRDAELMLLKVRRRINIMGNVNELRDDRLGERVQTEEKRVGGDELQGVEEVVKNREFGKAIHMLEGILRRRPDHLKARQLLENIKERARQQIKLNKLYEEGFNFYINSEFDSAIEKWSEILSIDPHYDDAREFISTARKELEKQLKTKELRDAATAAMTAGDNLHALLAWQELLTYLPNDAEALEHSANLQQVIESTKNYSAIIQSARQLKDQGRFDEARRQLEGVLKDYPEHPESLELLAAITQSEENDHSFKELMEKAEAAIDDEDYGHAIGFYEEALDIKPEADSALEAKKEIEHELAMRKKLNDRRQGIRQANRGKYVEALKIWLDAIDSPEVLELFTELLRRTLPRIEDIGTRNRFTLIYCEKLIGLEDYEKAIDVLREIKPGEPSYAIAVEKIKTLEGDIDHKLLEVKGILEQSQVLIAGGKIAQALVFIEKAVQESHDQRLIDHFVQLKNRAEEMLETGLQRGREAADAGNVFEAEKIFDQLQSIAPNDERLGELRALLDCLRDSLQLTVRIPEPNAELETRALAGCQQLIRDGKLDQARRLLEPILDKNPTHERALELLDHVEAEQKGDGQSVALAGEGTMVDSSESTGVGEETYIETELLPQAQHSDNDSKWVKPTEKSTASPSAKKKSSKFALRITIAVVLAALGFFGYLLYNQWVENQIRLFYEAGVTYYNQGLYDETVASMLKVLKFKPNYEFAKSYIDRANSRMQQLTEQKKNEEVVNKLLEEADELYKKGDMVASLDKINEILQRDKQNLEAKNRRAVLTIEIDLKNRREGVSSTIAKTKELIAKSEYDQAVMLLESLAENDSDNKEVKDLLNSARQKANAQTDRTNREQRAITLLAAAKTEQAKGNIVEAYDAADKAAAADPRNAEAAALKKQLEPQATQLRHDKQTQGKVAGLLDSARKAMKNEDYENAVSNLKELVSLDPNNAEAKQLLSQAGEKYNSQNRSNEQTKQYRDNIEKARSLIKDNRYHESIEFINKAAAIQPDSTEVKNLRDSATHGMALKDSTPPEIKVTIPSKADAGKDLTVKAIVTDDIKVAVVKLFYKSKKKDSYSVVSMKPAGDNAYEGVIPGAAVTAGGADAYVSADDESGNSSRSPSQEIKVEAPSIPSTGFF